MTTHKEQHSAWQQEHAVPRALPPMHAQEPSSGVVRLTEWLSEHGQNFSSLQGVEMGCGKGRNSLYLAAQGIAMSAFDFSDIAITEARKRAEERKVSVNFSVHDAYEPWPYASESFSIGVDCFASSDLESQEGRAFARSEFHRVLKPGAHLLVYAISSESPYHQLMMERMPAPEYGAFFHESGKFEKTFEEQELLNFYADFSVETLRRIRSTQPTQFYNEQHDTETFWLLLRK